MRVFKIFIFFLLPLSILAQKKTISVDVVKNDSHLTFYCKNTTDKTRDVVLTLKELKGIKGYRKPIIRRLKAKEKEQFIKVSLTGAYNYKYNVSSKSIPVAKKKSTKELITKNNKKKNTLLKREFQLRDFSKVKTGIVVFNDNNCPRCNMTTSYLLDNSIEFKYVDITANKKNKKFLYQILRENGHVGSFTKPVVVVDGKITHSHQDLKIFLNTLN